MKPFLFANPQLIFYSNVIKNQVSSLFKKQNFPFLFCFLLNSFALSIWAQTPQKLSYQAVLRDAGNALLTSTNLGVEVSVLQGGANGSIVYSESHNTSTNTQGLFTLEIGSGYVISGSFSAINWANGPFFVRTEIDPNGGSSYSLSSTSQLLSVPYALHAKTAESLVGGGSGAGGLQHFIGEAFGGGIVFDVWKDANGVEHGLIIDLTEITFAQFGLGSFVFSNSSWDGQANTNHIMTLTSDTNIAAAFAFNSSRNGFNDWYLPSVQELQVLWNHYRLVAQSLSQTTGATLLMPNYYWTSTTDQHDPYAFSFTDGSAQRLSRNSFLTVRAIRSF